MSSVFNDTGKYNSSIMVQTGVPNLLNRGLHRMVTIVQTLPISKPSVKKLAVILSVPGAVFFKSCVLCFLVVIKTISCRAGDACITYTVLNNDDEGTVEIESKFCGQVQLPDFSQIMLTNSQGAKNVGWGCSYKRTMLH